MEVRYLFQTNHRDIVLRHLCMRISDFSSVVKPYIFHPKIRPPISNAVWSEMGDKLESLLISLSVKKLI